MASGLLTEMQVASALIAHDLLVLRPLDPDSAYDLAVDRDDAGFVRVQCKTARQLGDCVCFNTHSTDHGRGRQDYRGRADVFGVWSPATRQVYVVPVDEVPVTMASLRLSPTRNNQARGVRWAADHTVDRWVARLGGRGEVAA